MTTFGDQVYHLGGVPVGLGDDFMTGNPLFVHATTGSDGSENGTKSSRPFKSLDYAIGKCTATNGDRIYLMPGHAETTTAIAADVAGIEIIGLGKGRARPALTATAAASDLIDVTAANILIRNLRLVGAASACTSLISIAANDFMCENCVLEHGATPLIAVIVTGGYDRFRFSDCLFLGTAANPDVSIDLQGSGNCVDWTVERCVFNYDGSSGLDLAGIRSSKTDTGVYISNCRFIGMDATAIDFNSSSSGILEFLSIDTTKATIAELIDVGLMTAIQCFAGTGAKKGTDIPTATAAD